MKSSPNERLLALIRHLTPTEAQNRLMRIADREIAVAMMFMDTQDRNRILGLLAAKKARLIREEFGLQKHRAVKYDHYEKAVENVIEQLRRGAARPPLRSFLRPRGRRM